MQAVEIIPVSHEAYLQGELESDIRHEYYDGHAYAMAGAGEKHNIISLNIATALRQRARGTDCRVFIADMKLYITGLNRFYYPDILLTCDPEDGHEYYKQRPCLIVEVLSPSTETTDRREKLHAYQNISSVKEYLLVSQEDRLVELYRRDNQDFKKWQYYLLNDIEDVLELECLDVSISMTDVYEDVLL